MRKNVFGRQFKRDTNERKALFKGLMSSLVMQERIQTTEEKAKAIKGSVEKLVTKAKKRGNEAQQYLLPYLHEDAVKKMMGEIAPRFTNRPGGFTRILRVGKRFNDNASMVLIEWVEKGTALDKQPAAKAKKSKKEQILEATAKIAKKDTKAKTTKKTVTPSTKSETTEPKEKKVATKKKAATTKKETKK